MHRPRSGFTLVEVLLVLAILAIVTVIAIPSFVHSLRGNRLRTAARTVTMAGRYARSMALLQQREMVLAFDINKATLTVTTSGRAEPEPESETGVGTASVAGVPADHVSADASSASGTVVRAETEVTTRTLEQVTIATVAIGDQNATDVSEGTCQIVYRSNGLCTPYRVTIVDMYGGSVTIDVDALGSTVTTEQ